MERPSTKAAEPDAFPQSNLTPNRIPESIKPFPFQKLPPEIRQMILYEVIPEIENSSLSAAAASFDIANLLQVSTSVRYDMEPVLECVQREMDERPALAAPHRSPTWAELMSKVALWRKIGNDWYSILGLGLAERLNCISIASQGRPNAVDRQLQVLHAWTASTKHDMRAELRRNMLKDCNPITRKLLSRGRVGSLSRRHSW